MENHLLDDHIQPEFAPKTYRKKSVLKPWDEEELDVEAMLAKVTPTTKTCEVCELEFEDEKKLKYHFMMVHEQLFRELTKEKAKVNWHRMEELRVSSLFCTLSYERLRA